MQQPFQNSRCPKILGAIRVTRSKVYTEDPPILGPTGHLVVAATRRREFVIPSIIILNPGKVDTLSKRYVPCILRIYRRQHCVIRVNTSTLGSRFATVRFTTTHFYDTCPVGPSTPDLLCVTVATQASFLYLASFQLFSGVHVFLLFQFQCSSFELTVVFPLMTSIKKTEKKKKSKQLTLHSFLMSSEPWSGPSSTKLNVI